MFFLLLKYTAQSVVTVENARLERVCVIRNRMKPSCRVQESEQGQDSRGWGWEPLPAPFPKGRTARESVVPPALPPTCCQPAARVGRSQPGPLTLRGRRPGQTASPLPSGPGRLRLAAF